MGKPIYSLADLQKEKEKLQIQRDICKSELIHSFAPIRSFAKDQVLQSVFAAGLLDFAVTGIQHLTAPRHEPVALATPTRFRSIFDFLLTLLPTLLPLLQTYFIRPGPEDRKQLDP
jgi:hypothetical protein